MLEKYICEFPKNRFEINCLLQYSFMKKSVSGIRFDYFSVVHITQIQALKS